MVSTYILNDSIASIQLYLSLNPCNYPDLSTLHSQLSVYDQQHVDEDLGKGARIRALYTDP
jgi:hypothetical protein